MSERDVLRTIIAEAGGNVDGMAAVANVINNRSQAWHQTPTQVVQAPGQFEGYTNPGPAIARQLDDPRLLEQARQVWNSVQNGQTSDPTNGGLYYHAAYINPGWKAPNGTVQIGGNVFYKGSAQQQPSATAALDEINRIVPIPALQKQAEQMAYAEPNSIVPLPVSRPTIPSDVGSLLPPPMAQLDPLLASGEAFDGGAAGASGTLVSGFPGAVMDQPTNGPPEATSNFNTPGYSNPVSSPQSSLATALQALASQRASNAASWQSILPQAIRVPDNTMVADAAPNVVSDATRSPSSAQLNSPSDSFLNDLQTYAAERAAQQNGGWLKTADPLAGNVALPPGVVPKSVQQDLPIVSGMQNGQTWGNAINSLFGNAQPAQPVSSIVPRLQPSSPAIGYGTGLTPTQVASIGTGGQNQGTGSLLPNDADAYTSPKGPDVPAVSAIQQEAPSYTYQQTTVLNPAYTQYQKSLLGNDVGSGPGSFGDLQAMNASTSLGIPMPSSVTNAVRASTPPPQYITVTKRIPLSTFGTVNPASQIMPGVASGFATSPLGHLYQLATGEPVSGGLLGLLFNHASSTPGSVSSAISGPAPGTNFLQAQGQNITPNTPDPVVANDFNQALYRNSGGGHFGV